MASRYDPQCFQAAFCLWYLKLDSKSQNDLFSYGPAHFEYGPDEETKTVNYVARGVTEHLKYELGLPENEQWIVLKWIQAHLDWELFWDARQIASTAISHDELHEMMKRAIITRPTANLRKPRPMAVEGGIFLAAPPVSTPRSSPAGSDSLPTLSSRSATPPSTPEANDPGKEAATRDPRKQATVACQTQTVLDPSRANGPLQSQEAAPEWFVWRALILGRGTPLHHRSTSAGNGRHHGASAGNGRHRSASTGGTSPIGPFSS